MPVFTPPPAQPGAAPQTSTELLFQPIRLGRYELPHRIVMAPLTRSRAGQPGNVPTPLNACYYAQRASAALIISEATQVSMQGQGYAWTPGIHSREQVEGWRRVSDTVHKAGGLIFMQLWHVGRISHPVLQPDGMLPVAPSALKPSGDAFIENENGEGELTPFVPPRALQLEEMPYLVRQFERAARNALSAGFDGVEVHGANGYLLDQFINSGTNQRNDSYGGPIENRARLLLEVVDAVCEIYGPDRVGVRLSPLGTINDISDDNREETFGYLAEKLSGYKLAYLHLVNPAIAAFEQGLAPTPEALRMLVLMREKYRGTLILAGGFDYDTAEVWLEQGKADLIAFGRKFLANPDLPERFRRRALLNAADQSTFYGGGAKGYTDYPYLDEERCEEAKPRVDESWR
ncbi:alkene reductase [Nitrosomonas sp. Nm33]|uniref:alkene reductase n=1 Tax=Nitrosomonas sp. Nm33 TaxID=133724 RepID=UPI00089A6BB3|nr:alkene reductase [Nitrosomonas sp. Nm33]SDY65007.1 N-ethylmaleimide reductase [Nitrosomonas sp. Nm33]